MIVRKSWAMPNKNTFTIKPFHDLIIRTITDYVSKVPSKTKSILVCDAFANSCSLRDEIEAIDPRIEYVSNDLDERYDTTYHLDAYDFYNIIDDERVDIVLFDPPFSPRQVSEVYRSLDKTVNMETTQASFWSKLKKQIGRITKYKGICLSFGWNSNGIGKTNGFSQTEIEIVAHGGNHNDTICTIETKDIVYV